MDQWGKPPELIQLAALPAVTGVQEATEPPDLPTDIGGVAGQLAAVARSVQQLQHIMLRMMVEITKRAPVHIDVDKVEIQRLGFALDTIDVNELSGELNIGITNSMKAGENGAGSKPPAPEANPLWQPRKGE